MAAGTSKAVKMMMCQGGLVKRQCWNGEERKADKAANSPALSSSASPYPDLK